MSISELEKRFLDTIVNFSDIDKKLVEEDYNFIKETYPFIDFDKNIIELRIVDVSEYMSLWNAIERRFINLYALDYIVNNCFDINNKTIYNKMFYIFHKINKLLDYEYDNSIVKTHFIISTWFKKL